MPPLQGFVNGSYETKSRIAAGERTINCLPVPVLQGGKADSALFPIHGTVDFATLTDGPGRGIFQHKERCFAVGGHTLFEVLANQTVTNLGAVLVDGNPATFDTNGDGGNELFVTSGGAGYIFDLGTSVFSTPLATGSNQGGQLDGFLLSLNQSTSTFRASASLDGLTWSGLSVAQRTSASDPWKAMIVGRNEIHLFGNKTGETWYNAGLPTFPFAQRPEGFYQTGIYAPFSLTRFNGSIAWLGCSEDGDPSVFVLDGYDPISISTPGLDWLLQNLDDTYGITDAVGWSYKRDGHICYVLTLPKPKRTFVYDALTSKWHERGYWDKAIADFTQYRPIFHAKCFGKNLVCDSESNKIYSLSSTIYTDVGGSELRRVRRGPHISSENVRNYIEHMELECERGVGNANDPGSDPQVGLRLSRDGGVTWGDSRMRKIGKRGKSQTRVRWENCGSGRDIMPEIWASDPVPTLWLNLNAGIDAGLH